jgi:hypothetical protein
MDDETAPGHMNGRRDSARLVRPLREEDAEEPRPRRILRIAAPDFDAKTWTIIIVSVLGVLTGNSDKLLGSKSETKAEIEEAALLKKAVSDLVGDMATVKGDVAAQKTSIVEIKTILENRLPEKPKKKGGGG